jgi:hypothetical protein
MYGRRLLEWILFWSIGHGIILFLATHEIYPNKFVASMITEAAEAPAWANWIISGAFGLLITFILEIFFWNRRLPSRPDTTMTREVITPSDQTESDRRALIAEARDLVSRLVRQYPDSAQFEKQLASDQIFYRLRSYFSEHFKMILRGRMVTYSSWEDSQIPATAARFLDEIERIEKKWNLT